MFNVFRCLSLFYVVVSSASFFSALEDVYAIQIVLGWFSFVSSCYIGYFRLFTLCKLIEVAFGLLKLVWKMLKLFNFV